MNFETEVIISLLKQTKNGPVSHELINKDAKVLAAVGQKLLEKLQNEDLIYLNRATVEASGVQRVRLALLAVQLGADIERATTFLQWKEFEDITAAAFERYGYSVIENLRFRHFGRRWEIDIVGYKKPLIVCVDCKHWHKALQLSTATRIVKEQIERTTALAESLPNPSAKVDFVSWSRAVFVPAVLSLVPGNARLCQNVPVVPILQMQDFLSQLPANADTVLSVQMGHGKGLYSRLR